MLKVLKELNKSKTILLMLLPATIYFIVFAYIPMGGVIMAFKQYDFSKGILGSPWNGLTNFRFFFVSGDALRVTLHTLAYNVVFIVVNTVLMVFFAILLSEISGRYFKRITQSILFLPYFVSWVILGAIIFGFFNYETGVFNGMLKMFGFAPMDVLNSKGGMNFLLIFFNAWKGVGYGVVIYLAAILNMDPEINEAAAIDGCTIFNRIRHITLPHMIPTITILTLLSVGRIFRGDLGLFYQLITSPQLFGSTDIIDTYVFRSLMGNSDMGMTAAAGFYQSVLCFVSIMILNYVVKKIEPDYALF